mmetsp:Transcript_50944/g.127764  ORF Transcript_50944/g.127764 Transcript_50944/m.127764 type:complete len:239 (+) Transcript_50944:470-1186(+)
MTRSSSSRTRWSKSLPFRGAVAWRTDSSISTSLAISSYSTPMTTAFGTSVSATPNSAVALGPRMMISAQRSLSAIATLSWSRTAIMTTTKQLASVPARLPISLPTPFRLKATTQTAERGSSFTSTADWRSIASSGALTSRSARRTTPAPKSSSSADSPSAMAWAMRRKGPSMARTRSIICPSGRRETLWCLRTTTSRPTPSRSLRAAMRTRPQWRKTPRNSVTSASCASCRPRMRPTS